MRILVVEDDAILLDGLSVGLGLAGFTVDAVASCGDAEAALAAQNYNAVVLDLMLPDGSGLDILKSMRQARDETPVLLLTARDQVPERIAGLDAGLTTMSANLSIFMNLRRVFEPSHGAAQVAPVLHLNGKA